MIASYGSGCHAEHEIVALRAAKTRDPVMARDDAPAVTDVPPAGRAETPLTPPPAAWR